MPHVTAIGFSHLQALAAAHDERRKREALTFSMTPLLVHPPSHPSFEPWFEYSGSATVYNGRIGEAVADACERNGSSLVALSIWSNQHFLWSTVNDPRPFDFILPAEPTMPCNPAAENIPYDLLNHFMERHFAVHLGLASFLRKFYTVPAVMLSAPPPIDDLDKIPPVSGGIAAMEQKARELGLAPPGLRYKFWRLCESIVLKFCAANGLPFIVPPAESWKNNGFRQPQYWSQDWIHANADYGDLVLSQIETFL